MKRTKEDIVNEAVLRMKALKIHANAVKEFECERKINISEPPLGGLFWLEDSSLQKIVNEFEAKHNCIVYHIVHTFTDYGEMYSFLYVNYDDEEWELDKEDIKVNQCLAYVYNKTYPDLSEFGSIGIQRVAGGLIRIW